MATHNIPQIQSSLRRTIYIWFTTDRWIRALLFILLALGSVAMFYPFIWMFFSSFKTHTDIWRFPPTLIPDPWTLEAYFGVLDPSRANLPVAYYNSLLVSAGTVISVLITSSMGGFVFARLDFPGRDYLFYFVLATTMVPFLTLLIPLFIVMRDLNMLNTLWAVFVPSMFSSFGIFLSRQFVYGVPGELFDAAKIDGASDMRIYLNLILPLTKPILSFLAILTFLNSFNSYLWPLVVLTGEDKLTLPLIISRLGQGFGSNDPQIIMAGSMLTVIPPIIIYVIFQRNFVQGVALTGLKG
ncbi:MAG: carbohydrate ABC transporter permease [Chloroflexota bacterium]